MSVKRYLLGCHVSGNIFHAIMAELPIISVAYDFDSERWLLQVTSYSSTSPAGPRLFRANPPDVHFSCDTEAEAKTNAATLQEYINSAWLPKKRR
jgi:hypothetical protein